MSDFIDQNKESVSKYFFSNKKLLKELDEVQIDYYDENGFLDIEVVLNNICGNFKDLSNLDELLPEFCNFANKYSLFVNKIIFSKIQEEADFFIKCEDKHGQEINKIAVTVGSTNDVSLIFNILLATNCLVPEELDKDVIQSFKDRKLDLTNFKNILNQYSFRDHTESKKATFRILYEKEREFYNWIKNNTEFNSKMFEEIENECAAPE